MIHAPGGCARNRGRGTADVRSEDLLRASTSRSARGDSDEFSASARLLVGVLTWILLAALSGCSEQDSLEEIREQHGRGRFEQSLGRLRAIVDQDPTNLEANFLLGTALLHTGEAGMAVWPLRKAAESDEHAIEAGLLLTRATLQGRFSHEAIKAVDNVLAIEPDNLTALELRVQAYLKGGRHEDALADIATVLEADPDNVVVLVPRVLALISLDRIEEAETALTTARETLEANTEEVGPPMRAKLCVATGLFAFENGEPERAREQYAECLEEYPTSEVAVQAAVRFYDGLGERERATEILRHALDESGESFFRLALAGRMAALGNVQESEKLLREEAEQRPSATAWFAVANHYVDREDYEAARDAFERALAASPDPSAMLRFAYADTLIQAGDYATAQRVAGQLEQEPLRKLIEGRIFLAQGKAHQALAAFEAGIKLWPNNAGARFLAGQAAERVGDFERASSQYRESVRANAGETEAGLYLARVYEALGAHAGALDSVGHYVRSHPEDPEGYRVTIRLAHRLGNRALVTEGLARLAALPEMAGVAAAEHASLLAADQGAGAARLSIERSGLDLSKPVNAPALRALLVQLAALDEHAAALKLCERALSAHPDAAVFHDLNARALRAAGEPEPARSAFERAVLLDPDNAPALAGLASLLADTGEREKALELYQRATAADPSDSRAAESAIELLLAGQDQARAEPLLVELLEHHPRSANAANELAGLLAARGEDLDRALELSQQASSLEASAEILETQGWIRQLRGEPDEAVLALTAALEARPDATRARYRLGLSLAAQGDEEGARKAFQQVVDTTDSGPFAEQAEAELARLDTP